MGSGHGPALGESKQHTGVRQTSGHHTHPSDQFRRCWTIINKISVFSGVVAFISFILYISSFVSSLASENEGSHYRHLGDLGLEPTILQSEP